MYRFANIESFQEIIEEIDYYKPGTVCTIEQGTEGTDQVISFFDTQQNVTKRTGGDR